jgi:hypothetical protein
LDEAVPCEELNEATDTSDECRVYCTAVSARTAGN